MKVRELLEKLSEDSNIDKIIIFKSGEPILKSSTLRDMLMNNELPYWLKFSSWGFFLRDGDQTSLDGKVRSTLELYICCD